MITFGPSVLFGIVQPKPLKHFPEGHARIRMRNDDFVRVFIRTPDGVREFLVVEKNEFWMPRFEQARNARAKRAL